MKFGIPDFCDNYFRIECKNVMNVCGDRFGCNGIRPPGYWNGEKDCVEKCRNIYLNLEELYEIYKLDKTNNLTKEEFIMRVIDKKLML